MGKKYSNPPIIEAVCEFRLSPETEWDLTTPGSIYNEIKDEFPNKEQRLVQEIQINRDQQGLQQQVRTSERMHFLTEDRKSFIQVGPHLLAINCLKPYPTWTSFKPHIEHAFKALQKTVKIKGLQRIGLRYERVRDVLSTLDIERILSTHDFPQHIASDNSMTVQIY